MSDAFVVEARNWADFIVKQEFRGPGDTLDAAMARCERKHKGILWKLRYRPPRDIFVSAYAALMSAYQSEIERAERRLAAQMLQAETASSNATDTFAYRFASSLVPKEERAQ